MNWQQVESTDQRGLIFYFTNDQPNTDFSISKQFENCYKMAIHTKSNEQGEFLKVVFKGLEDAQAHAEEMSKTENACTTNRIVDALAEYLSLARLLGERQESTGLG